MGMVMARMASATLGDWMAPPVGQRTKRCVTSLPQYCGGVRVLRLTRLDRATHVLAALRLSIRASRSFHTAPQAARRPRLAPLSTLLMASMTAVSPA